MIKSSARSRLAQSCSLTRHIFRGDVICCAHFQLPRYDCLIQIVSDMNLVDYLLTQRKFERYYKTSVSRERATSFLNCVPVDLEITITLHKSLALLYSELWTLKYPNNTVVKQKLAKNPNWQEADQLAINKAWRS